MNPKELNVTLLISQIIALISNYSNAIENSQIEGLI